MPTLLGTECSGQWQVPLSLIPLPLPSNPPVLQVAMHWTPRALVITIFAASILTPIADPVASTDPVRHALELDQAWQLNLPHDKAFGASGLLLLPNGQLLVVNDRSPGVFYVEFIPGTNAANLVLHPELFTKSQLAHLAPDRTHRYDIEGIARDPRGRIYLCDEAQRWILRCSPSAPRAERLQIDWSPIEHFFSEHDRNASFEGIAVGKDRLYVANERNHAVIAVVDLDSLSVVDHFRPRPASLRFWEPHYSDLSWHRGALYVLVRESRTILAVDPDSGQVRAEFDYRAIELDPQFQYQLVVPFAGVMEGLAVDDDYFWLLTDNNHRPRLRYPHDRRPTLFRCLRPDMPPDVR
jgi:hypothetical protein